MSTELGKTETITLTLTSVEGFAGTINVAPSLTDDVGAPIDLITYTGPATVVLAADGTMTAAYQFKVPSNATGSGLNAIAKLNLSGADMIDHPLVQSTVAVSNIFTVTYAAGLGGTTAMHPGTLNNNVTVKRGTKIHFHNADNTVHETHGGGSFPHEAGGGGQPNGTYEVLTTGLAPGSTGTLGCHTHGSATYASFTVQ